MIDLQSMTANLPLSRIFYYDKPTIVARHLLGAKLVRNYNDENLSGMIIETEAYMGDTDSASHAFRGKTPRTKVLFGEPGHAYVYFIYGMYNMLNIVTGPLDVPWAVLIRAIEPLERVALMHRRPGSAKVHTDGPGKVCAALHIDRSLNGWDLTRGEELWIEQYKHYPDTRIVQTPRIGIDYAFPEHRLANWRYRIKHI